MGLNTILDPLPEGPRQTVLAALDEISRPLTPAEIDDALYGKLSRRDRRAILQALKPFAIIAIIPPRD